MAHDSGVVIIAAAGNDSSNSDSLFPFPANKSYCLAVAALDSINHKADFSNYGGRVDLCAPGTRIYAPFPDTAYAWWDGTSFAAPFVAAVAALIWSVDTSLTSDVVEEILRETATDIDPINPGLEGQLGRGIVNPIAALQSVSGFVCGDNDGSGLVDISDVVHLINFIFNSGPAPQPLIVGNADCSGQIDISDAVYLIQFIFGGGSVPCAGCR